MIGREPRILRVSVDFQSSSTCKERLNYELTVIKTEREGRMKVALEFEFDADELVSIAGHRGKESASEADVRSFVREAINKALGDAIVEYKAVQNDPSANVGP